MEGNAVLIRLEGDKAPLGRFLRAMVAREQKCCAFLTLDLSETADGFSLRLGSDAIAPQDLRIFVEMLFPSLVVKI